jgi:hypothetical protein
MKTIILAFGILVLALSSCQKENIQPSEEKVYQPKFININCDGTFYVKINNNSEFTYVNCMAFQLNKGDKITIRSGSYYNGLVFTSIDGTSYGTTPYTITVSIDNVQKFSGTYYTFTY